jgi:gamma-glutamyl phosphate reductase
MGTKLRDQTLRTMAHVNDFPPKHEDTILASGSQKATSILSAVDANLTWLTSITRHTKPVPKP